MREHPVIKAEMLFCINRTTMMIAENIALKSIAQVPMLRLQKDIDDLFSQRKSLVRSGNQTSTLSSIYLLRSAGEISEPVLFLLHAPKRIMKQAPLRNKLKRWMREAIRQSSEIEKLGNVLLEQNKQVLLLLRADFKPSKDHAWKEIKEDVAVIGKMLLGKIQNSKLK